jgi:hypothetical protein
VIQLADLADDKLRQIAYGVEIKVLILADIGQMHNLGYLPAANHTDVDFVSDFDFFLHDRSPPKKYFPCYGMVTN